MGHADTARTDVIAPPPEGEEKRGTDRRKSDRRRPARRAAPAALLAEAIPFQDDLDEIIQEGPPGAMRRTHYIVALLFGLLIAVCALLKVEMVVSGTGQLTSDAPPIVLQPMERAILRDVKVKVGDVVKQGQVLATLDPTFTRADMASLSIKHKALLAQKSRLEAELEGAGYSPDDAGDPDETLQSILFAQRQSEYTARLRAFDEDILHLEANIKTTQDDRDLLAQQFDLAKNVEGMRSKLMESQTGSKLQFLDAQNTRMRAERDYLESTNRLVEFQHNLESKRAERQVFVDGWRRELLEAMVTIREQENQVGEELVKAVRLNDLIDVVAPQDGIVLDVAQRSQGSVLREAEPLITLVPTSAQLIAEVKIPSRDVGYAKIGNDVVVKVDAFPYQRHGLLRGRLRSVSEGSFITNMQSGRDGSLANGGRTIPDAFHRAQIELTMSKLQNLPDGGHLMPGMTVTAEIKVGSRSILSYFLNPITSGFDEVFKEP